MAGDWIPFCVETPRKPEIVRIAAAFESDVVPFLSRCQRDRFCALGLALTVWSYVGEHFSAPSLPGMTLDLLAEAAGVPASFCRLLVSVGWLVETSDGLELPNADWVTKAGKARLVGTRKKQLQRAGNSESCPDANGTNVPMRSGPEKRREEKKEETPPPPLGGEGESPSAPKRKKTKPVGVPAEKVPIPEGWDPERSRAAFARWIAYRAERPSRTPGWGLATWETRLRQIGTLARFESAVDHSIGNGWQGLIEPVNGASNGHSANGAPKPNWGALPLGAIELTPEESQRRVKLALEEFNR